jgi:hypothetical protein
VRVPARWHAPKGWRLLDMTERSNQPVPIRAQTVTLTLRNAADVALSSEVVTTDAMGIASVADVATATKVQITDRFGNVFTAPIP